MNKFKNKYRIASTRLKYWDYTNPGMYFVTICTHHFVERFGTIDDGKMILNEMGKIAEKYWIDIPDHFDNVELDGFVIMPNHVHGLIGIVETRHVGVSTGKQK